MLRLQLAAPDFSVRRKNEQPQVFDRLRKLWVKITPEEWVRQQIILMMTDILHFPAAYISVEKEIEVGKLKKRFDLLIYDAEHNPWMLVECKAPSVALSESTAAQLLRYQQVLQAKHLVITNGNDVMGWTYLNAQLSNMVSWPQWG
jgi:hypothetical protein